MASLDVIRTLTMRAKAEGFAQTESAVQSLGTATETSAKRQLSMEQSLQRYERQLSITAKNTQDFERVQRQMNMVLAANPALQERVNAVLAAAAEKYGQADTAARKLVVGMSSVNDAARKMVTGMSAAGQAATTLPKPLDRIAAGMTEATNASRLMVQGMSAVGKQTVTTVKANDQWASSTKASRFELLNLSRQLQDVGVSLAGGQNPFTVLSQQGSQIFDAFQSASASGRSLGTAILNLITPMRVLAVGTLATVAATVLLYTSWKNAELQLLSLSERLDVTIKQLDSLQAVAAITGIDDQAFQKGIAGFGDQVNLAKRGLGDLAELMRVNGKSAGDLEDSLFKVADLVKNAESGADKYRIAQAAGLPATAEWIRLLSKGGDALREARNEAASFGGTADDSLIKRARDFDEAWNKAWANFKLTAKDVLQSVFGWLLELTNSAGNLIKGVLGSATTRGDELGPLKVTVNKPTQLPSDVKAINDLERQHIQLLGNLATVEEKVRLKQLEINDAVQKGVSFREGEIAKILEIARLQEIANKSAATVSALGDAATAAEKYASQVDALKVKLADTTITQSEFNRAVSQLDPLVIRLKDVATELGDSLAKAFINGQNAADALNSSLKAVASTAASSSIKSLVTGLTGGGFDLPSIATGGLIAAGASFLSGLFGGDKEAEAAAQAADQKRMQEDQRKIEVGWQLFMRRVQASITNANDLASQLRLFDLQADAQRRAEQEAGGSKMVELEETLAQERLKVIDDFNKQVLARQQSFQDRVFAATTDTSTLGGALAAFDRKANQEREAEAKLGGDALADLEQALAAERLNIEQDFAQKAIDLAEQRAADELKAATDLAEALAEASKRQFEEAQQVIDGIIDRAATLNDRLFAANVIGFGQGDTLAGKLALFDRSAQQQREAEAKAGGQNLALLEEVLAQERLNIVDDYNNKLLAEQQAAADKLLDEQKRAEEQRLEIIQKANDDIIAYLNGLLTGQLSPLSAKAQLDAAQKIYSTQLALAQSGDVEALQNITKYADSLLTASKAFYGSSAGYQQAFKQVTSELGGLTGNPNYVSDLTMGSSPAMAANDNVVNAIGTVAGLLQQLVDLAKENNIVVPDSIVSAIANQTIDLNQEARFGDRKALLATLSTLAAG